MCDLALPLDVPATDDHAGDNNVIDVLEGFPAVRPPAPDLCPLWFVAAPSAEHAARCDVLARLVAWCDLPQTALRCCGLYGRGRYVLASPGGEVIERYRVE